MPFRHEVDHAHGLVVIRGDGEGSKDEGLDSFGRLMHDASLQERYRLMIVIDAVVHEPEAGELQDIARMISALRERFPGRKAIVTAKPGRVTTANLIALQAARDDDVRAFATEGAARDWLLAP